MQRKRKSARAATRDGLTALQLKTVRAIARERGLDLPAAFERDRAFCRALLDCFSIDRQTRPLAEVVRFVNNLTRAVEAGAAPADLAAQFGVPAKLAVTLHAYALKQLGETAREDWVTDRERLNRILEDEDAVV